eukprot:Seg1464.8 transcript_id=Seg1464.8/GoldUCD/mRNA.D3Y31 product="SHC-transforming protein 1" protein_id=Seg1464.8/GoldUCD/D3Y31
MKKRSIPDAAKAEWKNNGSFMHKPKTGWIHSEDDILRGVTYPARYVGCVKILQSVKALSLDDRSTVIKIATARCCDKAGYVKYKKKHKIPPTIAKAFGDAFIGYRGESILITISRSSIKIVLEKTGVLICDHYVENISFASCGEKDYSAFVSYIAKDNVFERACFVIECPLDIKTEVIQTIGQAFEAKYKEFVNKPPKVTELPERFTQPIFPVEARKNPFPTADYSKLEREKDEPMGATAYASLNRDTTTQPVGYMEVKRSDTVGSTDSNGSNDYSRLSRGMDAGQNDDTSSYDKLQSYRSNRPPNLPVVAGANYDEIPGQKDDFAAIYDNPMASPTTKEQMLMDFNENSPEYQSIPGTQESIYAVPRDTKAATAKQESPYDNPVQMMQKAQQNKAQQQGSLKWERFDDDTEMPATSNQIKMDKGGYLVPNISYQPSGKYASLKHDKELENSSSSAEYQSPEEYQHPNPTQYQPPNTHYQTPKQEGAERPKSAVGTLNDKAWFHGNISRIDAEMLIEADGQYLVRESSSSKGQYVLSGMKDSQHRHLLLVDPKGQVRTKDRTFATVEDLIAYHQNNNIPIISGGSEVHIERPIVRQGHRESTRDSFKI